MPAPQTSRRLRRIWLNALRSVLKERNFTATEEDFFQRRHQDGIDNLVLTLRAAGSGDVSVHVSQLAISVTLDSVEDMAAQLRQVPRPPNAITWLEPLTALSGLAGGSEWAQQVADAKIRVRSSEDVDDATRHLMTFVDSVADPWWQTSHDRIVLLDRALANHRRLPTVIESLATLAFQLDDRHAVETLLREHDTILDQRGRDASLIGNIRWHRQLSELLEFHDHGTPRPDVN